MSYKLPIHTETAQVIPVGQQFLAVELQDGLVQNTKLFDTKHEANIYLLRRDWEVLEGCMSDEGLVSYYK